MTHSRLTFGEMTVTGELARGVHPADELGLQMALALGQPEAFTPPFAVVPVLLDGHEIGRIEKVQFTWGAVYYEFTSGSGKTKFSYGTAEAIVEDLKEMLHLTS